MTSLEYPDNGVLYRTEYAYSGDDFLAIVKKYEGGGSIPVDEIHIVRDGGLPIQDRDGNNDVLRQYTWGLNLGGGIGGLLHLYLEQEEEDYSYLYDGNGNITAVLDASEAVVAAYRDDPFGNLLAQSGSLTQPCGFSTKRYDPQTGLASYGYRFYAPELGRWLTRDPLGEAGGINLYAFVGNNPVNWIDPFGLALTSIDASIEACLESPDIQTRIDCLKVLVDDVAGDVCDKQKVYRIIDKQQRQLLRGFRGFTKKMLSKSQEIAKGRKIKKIDEIVKRFGGKAKEWVKKKGWDEAGKEWHWYEHTSIGKVGVKPAGTPDPF